IPLSMYEDLVAAGTQEVSGSELVRRLVKSGLRITAAERSSKLEKILHQRFSRLFPSTSELERDPICDALLERWDEDHRHYHDLTHLMSVLKNIEYIERQVESMGPFHRAVKLASWFHDDIFLTIPMHPPGQDERSEEHT